MCGLGCVVTAQALVTVLGSQPVITVDGRLTERAIGRELFILRDPEGRLTIREVSAARYASRFARGRRELNGFGYTRVAHWIRFTTRNPGPGHRTWYLVVDYELLEHVDLYLPRARTGWRRLRSGQAVPFSRRPVHHRTMAFRVVQPPGRHTYYLRVQTTSPLNLPIYLYSRAGFRAKQKRELPVLWMYYGLAFALLLYTLILFVSTRELAYLFYVVYLIGVSLFMLIHNGLASELLWPDGGIHTNQMLLIAGILCALGMVLFGRSFLETRRTAPTLDRVLLGWVVFCCFMLVLCAVTYYPGYHSLASVSAFPIIVTVAITGIVLFRRGYRPARYYVLAWGVLIIGVLAGLLKARGLLPINFFTNWGYQLASAFEIVLLSLALADRINTSKHALEVLNTQLEDKVFERTTELEQTTVRLAGRTAELEGANEQLKREVHEREQAEERLVEVQKMDALGRLAGGLAHDMNNVLSAIIGNASFLLANTAKGAASYEMLRDVLEAGERGAELTRGLLTFARSGLPSRSRLAPNELVRSVSSLLRRTTSRKVVIETSLATDLAVVEGSADQIESVLMNLCLNSIQAMGDTGKLTITTENVTIEPGSPPEDDALEPGLYVRVRIVDNGCGMDSDTLKRAFEPFFTTKPQGRGTGLGLAIVYGTVKRHRGEVVLESEPGQGTTVTVTLPALAAAGEEEPAPKPPTEIMPGTGTILLVDDEAAVLRLGQRILESAGYEVIPAENGHAALERFEADQDRISLVILDMIMPELDGREIFHRLRAIDPAVRVLICTGFSDHEALEELVEAGAMGFILKPFQGAELTAAVARALGPKDASEPEA